MIKSIDSLPLADRYILFLLLLSVPVVVFAAKALVIVMVFVALACGYVSVRRKESKVRTSRWQLGLVIGFIFLSAISYLWSINQAETIKTLAKLGFACGAGLVMHAYIEALTPDRRRIFAEVMGPAMVITLLLVLIPSQWLWLRDILNPLFVVMTGDTVAVFFGYEGELVRQINRSLSLTVALVFLLMAFYHHRPVLCGILFIVMGVCLVFSSNQSALLGWALGGLAMAVFANRYLRAPALRLTQALLLAAALLVAPAMQFNYEQQLAAQLVPADLARKSSSNIRTWLYGATASQAIQRPLLGHGSGASRNLPLDALNLDALQIIQTAPSSVNKANVQATNVLASHPHNLFLQVFFELGVLGSLIFGIMLASIADALARAHSRQVPMLMGAFAAGLGALLFSYNMYQGWLISGALLLIMLGRLLYLARIETALPSGSLNSDEI